MTGIQIEISELSIEIWSSNYNDLLFSYLGNIIQSTLVNTYTKGAVEICTPYPEYVLTEVRT